MSEALGSSWCHRNRWRVIAPERLGRSTLPGERPELRGYGADDILQVAADVDRTYRDFQALAEIDAREIARLAEATAGTLSLPRAGPRDRRVKPFLEDPPQGDALLDAEPLPARRAFRPAGTPGTDDVRRPAPPLELLADLVQQGGVGPARRLAGAGRAYVARDAAVGVTLAALRPCADAARRRPQRGAALVGDPRPRVRPLMGARRIAARVQSLAGGQDQQQKARAPHFVEMIRRRCAEHLDHTLPPFTAGSACSVRRCPPASRAARPASPPRPSAPPPRTAPPPPPAPRSR